MLGKVVIKPEDLRHAARTYRAAGTKLGEIRTLLGTIPAAMPGYVVSDVHSVIDSTVRDLDEQIAYTWSEAVSMEIRATLAEQADAESLLAQFDASGLDVPPLSDQPPSDRPPAVSGDLHASVDPRSYSDWSSVAGGTTCPVGGGLIRGPNGQLYAIVIDDKFKNSGIPVINNPGEHYVDGVKPGSLIVGQSGSVSGVGPPIADSDRYAHLLINASGGKAPYGGYIRVTDPPGLVDVRSAGANAYPTHTLDARPPGSIDPPDIPPRTKLGRAGAVGATALPMVNSALEGLAAGRAMGNQRDWGYHVDYYQTEDGGRRARLNMYQVHIGANGQRYVTNALGHFDANGNLVVDEPRVTTKVG